MTIAEVLPSPAFPCHPISCFHLSRPDIWGHGGSSAGHRAKLCALWLFVRSMSSLGSRPAAQQSAQLSEPASAAFLSSTQHTCLSQPSAITPSLLPSACALHTLLWPKPGLSSLLSLDPFFSDLLSSMGFQMEKQTWRRQKGRHQLPPQVPLEPRSSHHRGLKLHYKLLGSNLTQDSPEPTLGSTAASPDMQVTDFDPGMTSTRY